MEEKKPRNPFGARLATVRTELRQAGKKTTIADRLQAIADEDADGDGFSCTKFSRARKAESLNAKLVAWGTEFGRTPGAQGDGRDHHPFSFCAWLDGGGIKGGVVHGKTDELGFHAVENRHYVTEIHATVLHQLGLD